MQLDSILNRGRATVAPVAAGAAGAVAPVAVQTRQLYANSNTVARQLVAPVAPASSGAALAAGLLAFAAVGVLVTMRVVFRGAIS